MNNESNKVMIIGNHGSIAEKLASLELSGKEILVVDDNQRKLFENTLYLKNYRELDPFILDSYESLFGETKAQRIAKIEPVKPSDPIGRNDQCPCKSGKKYKNCCLNK